MVTCHANGYAVYRNLENGHYFCSATKQEVGFKPKKRKDGDEPVPCDVGGAEIIEYYPFGKNEQSKKNAINQARDHVARLTVERGKEITKRVMGGQPTRLDGKTRSQASKRKVAVSASR